MPLQVQIASPCSEKWESMRGDDRARFCAQCSLHVFDVSALSETEVRALFARTGGRLCGRVFRRHDGTVLTRDCPTGVRALRLRFLRGLAAAATLITGLVGYRAATVPARCEPSDDAPPTLSARAQYALDTRLDEVSELLRETETLGPWIDRLFPRRRVIMGRFSSIRVIPPDASSAPVE